MFKADDSAPLSLEELTWLSASALIENKYALSESPSSERDAKALLRAVFHRSLDASIDNDDLDLQTDGKLSSRCNSPRKPMTSRRAQGPSESTPSINSHMSPGIGGIVSPFQSGGQPITPPPTPPRHHYYPRHLSNDYPSSSSSPSPSPSVSSSAFSSTTRLHQTEWIYRRPKPSNNSTLLCGHRSASANASCPSPQLSRSPSISSRAYHDNTSPTRGSKHRRRATAIPRPSSPVLISSTSQLVDSPESISKSPSNTVGLRGSANASVSSLQLQSAIRVSPLKHKLHGAPYSLTDKTLDAHAPPRHAIAMSPSLQRSISGTSTRTNNSASTAIWSALRAKSGTQAERNRILKSVPSGSQIITGSSVTPTFTVPVPLTPSLPVAPSDATPPRVPPKDRNTFNGTGTPSLLPSFSHTDKDRQTHRRDKFASAPPIPVPAGTNAPTSSLPSTRFGVNSSSAPSTHHIGAGTSTSPSSLSGASNSTIRISTNNRSRAPRNRTASLNSQSSIATATTSHTVATTGTTSSSTSSRLHPYTPTSPSSAIPVSPGVYNFRTSSHSSTSAPPSYLHGYGNSDKRYFHQRQNSSNSDIGINDGSTAAAVAARSQAYAQLTGASSAKRRPSNSSGSETPPYLRLYSNSHPYLHQTKSGFGGSSVNSFQGKNHGSAGTLIATPLSTSSRRPSLPPPSSSSVSLSRNGSSYVSRSPYTPITPHSSQPPPPKAKSILTRTSSMSTKNSGCGGTVKSVKFVEIPEIHYRSGFSEEDGNDFMFGESSSLDDEDADDDDDVSAVGAKGEGQEGIVLRDCMGIDVEAIDMDIDTYLGNASPDEEESRLDFKRKQGLGWNFLRGRKHERDADKGKEPKKTTNEKESTSISAQELKKEKNKSNSALGFKKLMGLTSRKAPPPPLTLSIGPPIPLHFKSTPTPAQEITHTNDTGKRRTSVSPSRKPISGPYALGSHLPSRSPLPPSPSSSFIHRTPATPARSPSNTSLNRLHGSLSRRHHHNYSSTSVNHGDKSHWNAHGRNHSSTPYTGPRRTGSLERPVGPNIVHTRPKGIMDQDVPGLDSARHMPLKNAPSYESFRSAKSYGGRSVRSEVGSVKSSKSVGAGSLRGFRTWVKKVSVHTGTSIPVAVVE